MSRSGVSPTFAVAAAFAVACAIAYAAIPEPGGVIHGCYLKTNGALRVIDPSSTRCSPLEIPISWNQAGREGPAGPAGPEDRQHRQHRQVLRPLRQRRADRRPRARRATRSPTSWSHPLPLEIWPA
jgi:hypothetical protein